jgi:hypothetical protein
MGGSMESHDVCVGVFAFGESGGFSAPGSFQKERFQKLYPNHNFPLDSLQPNHHFLLLSSPEIEINDLIFLPIFARILYGITSHVSPCVQ